MVKHTKDFSSAIRIQILMPQTETHTTTNAEEQIFDAALKVFSRKGKDGARMQEIAEEAGMNKASLHYYFRSKDRLYEAVFAHVLQTFHASLQLPMERDVPYAEALKVFINHLFDMHAEHPEIARLWMHENLNGAPVVGQLMKQLMDANGNAGPSQFLRRTKMAVDDGEILPQDPHQILVTVLGAVMFYFLAAPMLSFVFPGQFKDRSKSVSARKEHVFDILYHGLANPKNTGGAS